MARINRISRRAVSITKAQRRKFTGLGNRLVRSRKISGYQLQDKPRTTMGKVIYAHGNRAHTRNVIRRSPARSGKIYPRESYFKWDKSWGKPTKGTKLVSGGKFAQADEHYAVFKGNRQKNLYFLSRNTVNKGENKHIDGSWITPDTRVDTPKKQPGMKKAYLVTKKIDRDSEFSTIIVDKKNIKPVRDSMNYERVREIQVQDYKPKRHSLYNFIKTG